MQIKSDQTQNTWPVSPYIPVETQIMLILASKQNTLVFCDWGLGFVSVCALSTAHGMVTV